MIKKSQDAGQPERPFLPLGGEAPLQVNHHDHEDEQNHDGTGIDDDLNGGDERRVQQTEEPAQTGKGKNEKEGAMSLVLGKDHAQN